MTQGSNLLKLTIPWGGPDLPVESSTTFAWKSPPNSYSISSLIVSYIMPPFLPTPVIPKRTVLAP